MPNEMEQLACKVAERLQNAGHIAYFAGGCVRDKILGKTPHDYDIATNALPAQVQELFRHTVAVGAQFGVISVIENHMDFQVATFRSDEAYIDGRRPTGVVFSSPQLDAERRDFTINGMFFDPVKNEIIDFVGGRGDLEKRVLRAIGEPSARFREDRLRMLRAVRLATTLGFEIEEQTRSALREHAPEIHDVSAERIREELVKIFVSPNRLRGFDLLDESGLMAVVLPEIEKLKGCEQPPQFHPEGDVFVHTRRMIELLPAEVTVPLVFSVLFHDIGKPPTFTYDEAAQRIRFSGHDRVGADMTRAIMERLRFSRDETEATVEMVAMHMVFKDVKKMRPAKVRRFMARPTFEQEMELHKVDCMSSNGLTENYDFLREKKAEFASEPLIPPPLVTGRDLLALGWKPGKKIGEILEAVQTRQLEEGLATHDEAIEWVKREFAGPEKE